jgi:DNA-binding response OmpR family regulator
VDAYLAKPFSMRKFVRAVQVALENRQVEQDAHRTLERDAPRETSKR